MNKEKYNDLMKYLYENKDEKYKEFNKKLLKDNSINVIGIRIPELKKIAKKIAKEDYNGFIKNNTHKTFEESTLHGLVLGYIKTEEKNLLKLIDEFLLYNNNWATNDTTCSNLKVFKNIEIDKTLKYINNDNPWTIRFGLILLLNHYINEENIDKILKICDNVKSKEYYVQMANAWLISMCYIKFKDKTYNFLLNNNLDKFTLNKSISKICDSYRVSNNDKKIIKKLRK